MVSKGKQIYNREGTAILYLPSDDPEDYDNRQAHAESFGKQGSKHSVQNRGSLGQLSQSINSFGDGQNYQVEPQIVFGSQEPIASDTIASENNVMEFMNNRPAAAATGEDYERQP